MRCAILMKRVIIYLKIMLNDFMKIKQKKFIAEYIETIKEKIDIELDAEKTEENPEKKQYLKYD